MLNVTRLKVLREVAQHGSFSAAAAALDYTQSALSQAVAPLEAETGAPLLHRDRRGVRPTAAGAALIAHADGILARIEAAEADVQAILGVRGGGRGVGPLPPGGEPEDIAPRLRAGEFDLALLFEFRGGGTSLGAGLARTELLED